MDGASVMEGLLDTVLVFWVLRNGGGRARASCVCASALLVIFVRWAGLCATEVVTTAAYRGGERSALRWLISDTPPIIAGESAWDQWDFVGLARFVLASVLMVWLWREEYCGHPVRLEVCGSVCDIVDWKLSGAVCLLPPVSALFGPLGAIALRALLLGAIGLLCGVVLVLVLEWIWRRTRHTSVRRGIDFLKGLGEEMAKAVGVLVLVLLVVAVVSLSCD